MVYFSESQTLIKINFYVARNASCNRVGGPVYLCVAPTSSTRAASFLQIRRPLVSHFPSARDVAAGPENAPVNSPAPANGIVRASTPIRLADEASAGKLVVGAKSVGVRKLIFRNYPLNIL